MNIDVFEAIKSAVWFVTALVSVAVGLSSVGISFLTLLRLAPVQTPLFYAIGLCGVISLVMFFVRCSSCSVKGEPK